jgi:hypothetical protein
MERLTTPFLLIEPVGEVLMNCVKEQMLMRLLFYKPNLQIKYRSRKSDQFIPILDTVGRNKMGIAPLKPFLKIDAVKNAKDLEALLIEMEPIGGIDFMCWRRY